MPEIELRRRSPRRAVLPRLDRSSTDNSLDPSSELATPQFPSLANISVPSLPENQPRQAPSGANVDHDDGMAELDNPDAVSDSSKVFTYFNRMTRKLLQDIARAWGRRSRGNKREFIYRNVLFVLDAQKKGQDYREVIRNNKFCTSFEGFLKQMDDECLDFDVAPSEEEMKQVLMDFGDTFDENVSAPTAQRTGESVSDGNPNFSHSEFARLCVILRDDEEARKALMDLQQPLELYHHRRNMNRDSFWEIIADRFNDTSLAPQVSFQGTVPEADPSLAPLCERSASILKDYFSKMRSNFSHRYNNFNNSGRNDPRSFKDFLGPFVGPNREPSAEMKRVWIFFTVARCETSNPDAFLIQSTLRTFDGGQDEGAGKVVSGSGENSSSRKRRLSLAAREEEQKLDQRMKLLDERWDTVRNMMGHRDSITETRPITSQFEKEAEKDSWLGMLETAVLREERVKNSTAPDYLKKVFEQRREDLLAKYEAFLNSSQEGGAPASAQHNLHSTD